MAGKTKTHRWVCPVCGAGVLAPSRPRRDDIRRFCFPCSKKEGRLVPRICPVLDQRRATKEERTKVKASKQRAARVKRKVVAKRKARRVKLQTERKLFPLLMAPIRSYFERWQRLKSFGGHLRGTTFQLRFRKRGAYSTGRAYSGDQNRIVLTAAGPEEWVLCILLHEMAHIAAERGRGDDSRIGHGLEWRRIFLEAATEVLNVDMFEMAKVELGGWDASTYFKLGKVVAEAFKADLGKEQY